ncbi:hypothetical protein DCAR_0311017 [Daucus carota subsp. sativus]|uniref:Uncharacterized protein n=1 Tax=Daucus carota subsp. sativus TaxID=79200 RepID=A0A166ABN2_DAUCS|nr:hypothetical protein DCAR_0311017 [Daucus carota subsp. sativus]
MEDVNVKEDIPDPNVKENNSDLYEFSDGPALESVQVIGLFCRTHQNDSRSELLRRVAAGGGAFKRPGWDKSSSCRSKPKRHSFDYVL